MLHLFFRRKNSVKSARIQSCSGPPFPAFGLNTERYGVSISPYSVRMRENADQKNSEYGQFSRSETPEQFHRWIKIEFMNPHLHFVFSKHFRPFHFVKS